MLNTNEELQSWSAIQYLSSMKWTTVVFGRKACFVFIVTYKVELSPLFVQIVHKNYYKIVIIIMFLEGLSVFPVL